MLVDSPCTDEGLSDMSTLLKMTFPFEFRMVTLPFLSTKAFMPLLDL